MAFANDRLLAQLARYEKTIQTNHHSKELENKDMSLGWLDGQGSCLVLDWGKKKIPIA
jgi:hypothetical protein